MVCIYEADLPGEVMDHFIKHWRGYARLAAIVLAEMVLAGAAEGPQKIQFIEYGTVSIAIVAATFKFL